MQVGVCAWTKSDTEQRWTKDVVEKLPAFCFDFDFVEKPAMFFWWHVPEGIVFLEINSPFSGA